MTQQGFSLCAAFNISAVRAFLLILPSLLLAACGTAFMVNEDMLQPGSAGAVSFKLTGRPSYDQVWNAATKAMGTGMTIVYSHKPSGTIKSRVGSAPSGRVVAFFITPTSPTAVQYQIETVSKQPHGLGLGAERNWEPSVIEDFKAALAAK
jgi:hypothetical protein